MTLKRLLGDEEEEDMFGRKHCFESEILKCKMRLCWCRVVGLKVAESNRGRVYIGYG